MTTVFVVQGVVDVAIYFTQLAHVHDCSFFETSAKTGHNIEQVSATLYHVNVFYGVVSESSIKVCLQVFYEVAHGIMIRHGIFIPGRLVSCRSSVKYDCQFLLQPSLGPVVFARSDSASISGSKSIKLLTSTDLEAETQQKKKCCLQSN